MKIKFDKNKVLDFCALALTTAILMWVLYFIVTSTWQNLHSDTWWISSHLIAVSVGVSFAIFKDKD